ncbi:TATA-binding protein-associated factor mot1, partial [Ascosphaera aggregata]
MTSRLDRLVTLLDTGSTPVIRNTAAQQLADVQKSHPDELLNLLARILPYLRSKSWETRTAAAKAIGGVVSHAPLFDPNADDDDDDDDDADKHAIKNNVKVENGILENGSVTGDRVAQNPELFTLETLNLPLILRNGQKLLGSAGTEIEMSYAGLDPAERLLRQKRSLLSRLGLVGTSMDADNHEHEGILNSTPDRTGAQVANSSNYHRNESSRTTSPVLSRKNSVMSPPASAVGAQCQPQNQSSDEYARLSKRQLNQLKRKNKHNAKMGSNKIRIVDLAGARKNNDSSASAMPGSPNGNGCSSPHPIKKEEDDGNNSEYFSLDREGPDDDSKIVSEFKGGAVADRPFIQAETQEQGNIWPYERMCEFLMVDLFDPTWEIRHGAAMGLREVIRVQGKGAGRAFGKTRARNDAANRIWLNDLACRLLCVFLLDRFGDYVSDNVVAPIRETVGQTLGALLSHLPDESVMGVYSILYRMIMQQDLELGRSVWE